MTTFGNMTSKNKLDKSSLNYKLDQLNKERKADTRMQNTIKQRFQAKYGPLFEKEVVYRPGFCYHRDGQPRDSDEPVSIEETEDYKELLDLLFTNGDLDNRKVLCIHVLSAHPCECLKPPKCRVKPLAIKSPMERLIERSKSIMMDPTLTTTHNLPTYILNVNQNKSKSKRGYNQKRYSNECCIRDGRLATRFIVNDFVAHLVSAVLEALHRANPAKMSSLMRMSHNPQFIREILNSAEMQPFLQSLNSHKFLISSNSYYLTRPFMNAEHIRIENPSLNLVKLVNKIRGNVLRHSELFGEFENRIESEDPNKILEIFSSKMAKRGSSFNAEKMSQLLNNKIRDAQERDLKQLRRTLTKGSFHTFSQEGPSRAGERESVPVSTSVYDRLHANISSPKSERRKPCTACDERYLQLLPSKRSNERNSSLRSFNQDTFNAIITKSTQWLNFRINEEMEKLHDERIATRNENLKKAQTKEVPKTKNINLSNESRRFSYLQRKAKNYAQYYGYKINDSTQVVNNLNLAKIKHEISVKENIKRVKKFLEEPLLEKKNIVSTPDDRIQI